VLIVLLIVGIDGQGGGYQSCSGGSSDTCGVGQVCSLCENNSGGGGPPVMQCMCTDCPAGKYQPSSSTASSISQAQSQPQCTVCPGGTFSNARSSACTKCPSGFYSTSQGSSSCSPCATGRVADTSGTSCSLCMAGKFGPISQSSPCSNCTAGTFAVQGSTTCTLCEAGRYNSLSLQSSCITCPFGSYQEKQGSLNCTMCSSGASEISGSPSVDFCLPCAVNQYAYEGICKECPPAYGAECDGRHGFKIKDGFMMEGATVIQCVPQEACIASAEYNQNSHCSQPYTRSLCSECSIDYYMENGKCQRCATTVFKVLTITFLVLIVLLIILRLLKSKTNIPPDLRIILQAVQTISMFPQLSTKWPPPIVSFLKVLSISVRLVMCLYLSI
jgi:hypothetical protein